MYDFRYFCTAIAGLWALGITLWPSPIQAQINVVDPPILQNEGGEDCVTAVYHSVWTTSDILGETPTTETVTSSSESNTASEAASRRENNDAGTPRRESTAAASSGHEGHHSHQEHEEADVERQRHAQPIRQTTGLATAAPTPSRETPPEQSARPNSATTTPTPTRREHGGTTGRAIGTLSATRCLDELRAAAIEFESIAPDEAPGIEIPIRVHSSIGGILVSSRGHSAIHELMDCRMAVALARWAPRLREAGIQAIRHYSVYRPNARIARSGRVSGHAHGMAIDLALVDRVNSRTLSILEDWTARERGAEVCTSHDEGEESRLLRRIVCDTVDDDLFQVVLTPHYDHAHRNHVHLEIRPRVTWSYVH